MAPSTVYLPNGQTLTVTPVFGGLAFRSNDLSRFDSHRSPPPFPPGWTIVLHSEDDEDENGPRGDQRRDNAIHRYKRPTRGNDHIFISSISNPSGNDFKPAGSPTRQIAMMLWVTLWWYFHQPEPDTRMLTSASASTPEAGRPRGPWKVYINREGIFKGRNILAKLERMGLIASEDSSVGLDIDERTGRRDEATSFGKMFVSRRSFWQLDPRIYLYNLTTPSSPYPSISPINSRPGSPNRADNASNFSNVSRPQSPDTIVSAGLWSPTGPGPFTSSSHLPTYYPPPPTQYVFTNNIMHPLRPKPPRQGELFYSRYIPSMQQYLSFRVPTLASTTPRPRGPITSAALDAALASDSTTTNSSDPSTHQLSDVELLHKWMNNPRVSAAWGEQGPITKQEHFLRTGLSLRHSFPLIGTWDGKPFGYFEVYWVKEDRLGAYLGGDVGDYDRGLHCLVGEDEFRGPDRVKVWLSSLVHACWLADMRTERVMLEPRVDNQKLAAYLTDVGFYKEREISLPHKQANVMKITRAAWESPFL